MKSVRPIDKPPAKPPEGPSGLPIDEASSLVAEATERLWAREGRDALTYLHNRGLTDETIKARGLGWTPGAMLPTKDGDRCFEYWGVTIPWMDGAVSPGSRSADSRFPTESRTRKPTPTVRGSILIPPSSESGNR